MILKELHNKQGISEIGGCIFDMWSMHENKNETSYKHVS
jgi:hypothetical protein